MSKSNNFNERCYQLLKQIPTGRVVTYGDIAHALNCKAYQAVGNAMGENPNPIVVPCHRVVKSNGDIGQFALGVDKKIELLESEGLTITQGRIANFASVRFKFPNAATE